MSDLDEFFTAFRIAIVLFVMPAWALATGFFLWEGMYLYVGLMIFFAGLTGYGVYRNFDRLMREDKLDDERMKTVNRRAGSSAFWTVLNTAILANIFSTFIGLGSELTQLWYRYDTAALIMLAFTAYLGFRVYYMKYGIEADFWNLK